MSINTLNRLVRNHAGHKIFDPLKFNEDKEKINPYKVFKKKGATNDRGVEFTTDFIKDFYRNCEWSESFNGTFIGDPKDADERRDRMLAEICN